MLLRIAVTDYSFQFFVTPRLFSIQPAHFPTPVQLTVSRVAIRSNGRSALHILFS